MGTHTHIYISPHLMSRDPLGQSGGGDMRTQQTTAFSICDCHWPSPGALASLPGSRPLCLLSSSFLVFPSFGHLRQYPAGWSWTGCCGESRGQIKPVFCV